MRTKIVNVHTPGILTPTKTGLLWAASIVNVAYSQFVDGKRKLFAKLLTFDDETARVWTTQ